MVKAVRGDIFAKARREMVDEIVAEIAATADMTGCRVLSPAVRRALEQVPRHLFVTEFLRDLAYVNVPQPIGHGQTISQPYMVALMTELVRPTPAARILEIGTGAGYQAAVLAEVVAEVYTIERIEALATRAQRRLRHLGYGNVHVRYGDGRDGWPDHAPYDGILITAASATVPPRLIGQLRPGARLLMPQTHADYLQYLKIYERGVHGLLEQAVLPVAFVPLLPGTEPSSSPPP